MGVLPTKPKRYMHLVVFSLVVTILLFHSRVANDAKPEHERRHAVQKPLTGPESSTPPARDDGFPKKIWQTWRLDPFSFDQRDSNRARSWPAKNPSHRYELLTDGNDVTYLEDRYAAGSLNRPDIVAFYRALNDSILKADLLRYLVMYADGGVYADIDAEALKPVSRFVPARYDPSEIDMVIGIEIDQPEFRHHPVLGSKSMSFCQWTFMCRPGLPIMLRLVEDIMGWLSATATHQNVTISEVVVDFDGVISGTGPTAFTVAILEEMNSKVPAGRGKGEKITWSQFHRMDESKVVNRVLVLDVEAFAAGQGHSDSGNHNARGALVHHHYGASAWPRKHPRYSHPAYGEVEHCNWDAACIKKWDENVRAYSDLPSDEKQRKAAERKAEQARETEKEQEAEEQARKLEQLGIAERKAKDEGDKEKAQYGQEMGVRPEFPRSPDLFDAGLGLDQSPPSILFVQAE